VTIYKLGPTRGRNYLVPTLWSEVWQKRKRTSLRLLVNAYLADILEAKVDWLGDARERHGLGVM